MFERFSEKARRVIFFTRYEASERYQPLIIPEDILLGILRENRFLFMSEYQVPDPMLLLNQVRAILVVSEVKQGVDLPFSPEAEKLVNEASQLAEIEVTPWFLLWVIYPALNSDARDILEAHGITRDSLTEKKLV
jgi:ATP-dependent Clp protease ATP-binding subunit ClpC